MYYVVQYRNMQPRQRQTGPTPKWPGLEIVEIVIRKTHTQGGYPPCPFPDYEPCFCDK